MMPRVSPARFSLEPSKHGRESGWDFENFSKICGRLGSLPILRNSDLTFLAASCCPLGPPVESPGCCRESAMLETPKYREAAANLAKSANAALRGTPY
jgi:hypothetical protein